METLQKNQTVRAVIEGYSSEGLGIARVNGQGCSSTVPSGARTATSSS